LSEQVDAFPVSPPVRFVRRLDNGCKVSVEWIPPSDLATLSWRWSDGEHLQRIPAGIIQTWLDLDSRLVEMDKALAGLHEEMREDHCERIYRVRRPDGTLLRGGPYKRRADATRLANTMNGGPRLRDSTLILTGPQELHVVVTYRLVEESAHLPSSFAKRGGK